MTDVTEAIPAPGRLVVVNRYPWIGDPRLGAFAIYLDGRRVGSAPVGSSLSVVAAAGEHVVRARLWWCATPPTAVVVPPGATATLTADLDRTTGPGRRFLTLLARPHRSLRLDGEDLPPGPPLSPSPARLRRALFVVALLSLLMCVGVAAAAVLFAHRDDVAATLVLCVSIVGALVGTVGVIRRAQRGSGATP